MNPKKLLVPSTDPILKQVCERVAPDEDVSGLIEKMAAVCRKCKGAGLAAPQIGVAKQVIYVMGFGANGAIRGFAMINPEITEYGMGREIAVEGCLSYPGIHKRILRSIHIKVVYEDESRKVSWSDPSGFAARVIQHEVDHLSGICRVGDPSYPEASEDFRLQVDRAIDAKMQSRVAMTSVIGSALASGMPR